MSGVYTQLTPPWWATEIARLRAEITRLEDRLADLELDNEGLTKLVDSYKRVAVLSDLGWVLKTGELDLVLADGRIEQRIGDYWVKGTLTRPAGSFDQTVCDEIHAAYQEATR